jgi:hypothetical protein
MPGTSISQMAMRTTTTRTTPTTSGASPGNYNRIYSDIYMPEKANLPIYHKLYQLTKDLYKMVHNMEKEYKYTLGRDILAICWACLDLFLEANSSPNCEKHSKIEMLSLAFDKLKIRLRMSQDLDLISIGQYAHLQELYVAEIGNMIGGWSKWSEGNQS